jgi:hypothetical protein
VAGFLFNSSIAIGLSVVLTVAGSVSVSELRGCWPTRLSLFVLSSLLGLILILVDVFSSCLTGLIKRS